MKVFLGIVAAILLVLALRFGSVTPCGILRSQVREAAARAGGMGALVGALPDSMIDGLIATQYGPLTPGRCIALLLQPPPVKAPPQNPRPVPIAPPTQSNMTRFRPSVSADAQAAARQAGVESREAEKECRDKRLSGELPSYTASAACSNPKILEAYRKANYRYMDLIFQMTSKRAELAEQVDQSRITETQSKLELSQFMTGLIDEERARDRGQR